MGRGAEARLEGSCLIHPYPLEGGTHRQSGSSLEEEIGTKVTNGFFKIIFQSVRIIFGPVLSDKRLHLQAGSLVLPKVDKIVLLTEKQKGFHVWVLKYNRGHQRNVLLLVKRKGKKATEGCQKQWLKIQHACIINYGELTQVRSKDFIILF